MLQTGYFKRSLSIFFLVAGLNLTGCGTLVSLVDEQSRDESSGPMYSGVKLNMKELKDEEVVPVLKIINIIDLPLSAILDTVFLPVTWWLSLDPE
ncbi:MAG: YceK/YidQ family lipoprotein [Moraxellaceae bacterium]|nr:MAG: YceK/YidQ family lipoprotein [Moraxellaceae bacterium]